MKDRIVCVEWDDASFSSGYYDKDDKTGKFAPWRTKTAGFVVRSDRKSIVISGDRFYDAQGKLDDERHITVIPRAMIRHIAELKER